MGEVEAWGACHEDPVLGVRVVISCCCVTVSNPLAQIMIESLYKLAYLSGKRYKYLRPCLVLDHSEDKLGRQQLNAKLAVQFVPITFCDHFDVLGSLRPSDQGRCTVRISLDPQQMP